MLNNNKLGTSSEDDMKSMNMNKQPATRSPYIPDFLRQQNLTHAACYMRYSYGDDTTWPSQKCTYVVGCLARLSTGFNENFFSEDCAGCR